MGFKGRVLELRWPVEHPLHGMEVDLRTPSVSAINELGEGRRDSESSDEFWSRRLQMLCDHVVNWNLEDSEGTPLPCMPGALVGFDAGAVIEVIDAWADNSRIPAPSITEDPASQQKREPLDPLVVTSGVGSGTGLSSAVEAQIPTQAL